MTLVCSSFDLEVQARCGLCQAFKRRVLLPVDWHALVSSRLKLAPAAPDEFPSHIATPYSCHVKWTSTLTGDKGLSVKATHNMSCLPHGKDFFLCQCNTDRWQAWLASGL